MSNRVRIDAAVNDKVSGPLDRIKGKFEALGKSGAGQGLIAGLAGGAVLGALGLVSSAIGGVVDKLGEAQAAYREDEASQARLRASLAANVPAYTGNTDAIEKVLASRMRLGFSDDEQRASLAQLVTRTHDSTKALELQQTAMDLARLKGMSLEQATNLIGKAYSGNVSALTRAGIAVDKNATATEALAAVQKAAAGQAEAFANTSEGRVLASQLKVGESMERIGLVVAKVSDVVLPILADAFEKVIDVIGDVVGEVESFLRQNQWLVDSVGFVANIVGTVLVGAFDLLTQHIRNMAGIWTRVFGAIFDVVKGVVSGIIGAIRNVMDVAAQVPGPWQEAAAQMRDTLAGMQRSVESWGTSTATHAGKAADDIVANVGTGLAGGAGVVASGAETGITDPILDAAEDGRRGAVATARKTPQQLADALLDRRTTWQNAWEKYKETLSSEMDKGAEIAKLKGILQSKRLAAGLKSQDPVVRAAAEALRATVQGELVRLQNGTRLWGTNAGVNYAKGLRGTQAQVAAAARYLAQAAANNLEVRSPAKEGPLSRGGGTEGWGERAGGMWADGLGRAFARVRRMASLVASGTAPLSGGIGAAPMTVAAGSGTGVSAIAGGGDTFVIQFHTPVTPSAAQREELERMLTPIIVEGLRRRRVLAPSGMA